MKVHPPLSLVKPFTLCSVFSAKNAVQSYWFVFLDNELLLADSNNPPTIPCTTTLPVPESIVVVQRCIGIYDGTPCIAVRVDAEPEGFMNVRLRKSRNYLDHDLWIIAGRARQILRWEQDNKFCGRCGNSMHLSDKEFSAACDVCGFLCYPQLNPAVIMAVTRGREILLGHSRKFAQGVYSVLAGFIEPGETIEEAVYREVLEETAIKTTNIRYIASQSWPFPNALMLGCSAEYASGEINIDRNELEDAQWFTPETMPTKLPPQMTIARRLIDLHLEEYL